MFWIFRLDENDPIRRSYRHYFRLLGICGVVLLLLAAVVLVAGVPHIQTSYSYRGPVPDNGVPTAHQKTAAWYLSVTGWHYVHNGQYGHNGLPIVLFIPLNDCIGTSQFGSYSLFFEE